MRLPIPPTDWERLRFLARYQESCLLPAPPVYAAGSIFIAPIAVLSLDGDMGEPPEEPNQMFDCDEAGLSLARSLVDRSLDDRRRQRNSQNHSPARTALECPKIQAKEAFPTMTPSIRLLIADDNEENVFLLQAYLAGQPAVIETVSNGLDAFEKRRHKQYDLMLMDLQMPVMDGLAATREIRKWERQQAAPSTPILALTAHSMADAGVLCQEAGCDGYLSKPIEKEQLLKALSTYVRDKPPEPVDPAIAALQPRYLANRRNDLAKVNAAREKGDFDSIRKLAHDWKGSGAGYGFPEISQVGRELEQAAIRRDASDVAAWIGEMESRVGRLLAA